MDIGFPPACINLIWHCLSSSRMHILWKGEALEEFKPSRGIRKGDLISPYLFVLCIERLSHLINLDVGNRLWAPIKLSRGGHPLSHLAFADDLMLFAEVTMEQVGIVKTCLDLFCASSG